MDAWEDIGSGDAERIQQGNADLLLREQERVIQDDYDAMREHHGPVGDVFTYGFSTMAENPMPGGQAYRDYDPIELTVDLVPDVPVGPLGPFGPHIDIPTPDVEVSQTLPLPAGQPVQLRRPLGLDRERHAAALPGPAPGPERHPRDRLERRGRARRGPAQAARPLLPRWLMRRTSALVACLLLALTGLRLRLGRG